MQIERDALIERVSGFLSELLKDTRGGYSKSSTPTTAPRAVAPLEVSRKAVNLELDHRETVLDVVNLVEKILRNSKSPCDIDSDCPEETRELVAFDDAENFFSNSVDATVGVRGPDCQPAKPRNLHENADAYSCSVSSIFSALVPLAQGGLGKVSVATDQQFSRRVAIKQIKDEYSNNAAVRSRFLREASVTGYLQHPSIVPVYGVGEHADGHPFYAMKLIEGESLRDALKKHDEEVKDRRSARWWSGTRRLLQRLLSAANAIAYAHERGIIHRDIKPDNIMLGDFGETVVVDWGLAWGKEFHAPDCGDAFGASNRETNKDARFTQLGMIIGTPGFMAPEQASGAIEEVGPASDIYSLGATLTFLLTGKPLVSGESVRQLLANTQQGRTILREPSPPEVPRALWSICRKACTLIPADRYVTVREFTQDIERFLSDDPIEAHRDSVTDRLKRWIRRNPAKTVGLGLSILFGFAITGTAFVQQKKFNNRLTVANEKYVARSEEFQQLVQESIADLIHRREFRGPVYAAIRLPLLNSLAPAFESLIEDEISDPSELASYASHLSLAAHLDHELGNFDNANTKLRKYRECFGLNGRTPPKTTEHFENLLSVLQLNAMVQLDNGDFSEAERTMETQVEILNELIQRTGRDKYYLSLANLFATWLDSYRRLGEIEKGEKKCVLALDALEKSRGSENEWDWFDRHKCSTILQHAALFYAERCQEGDYRRFIALQRESMSMREELYKLYPGIPIVADAFAESNRLYASIMAKFRGPHEAAKSHSEIAKSVAQRLYDRYPEVAIYCANVAEADYQIGLLHKSSKESQSAAWHFEQAIKTCKSWEKREGEAIWSGRTIALSLDQLSLIAVENQQLDKAIDYASTSQETWNRLASSAPETFYFQVREAGSRTNIGTWLRRRGSPDKAIRLLQRSISQLKIVESNNDAIPELRNNLLVSNHSLAIAYVDTEDHVKAAEYYRAAAAYVTTPKDREKFLAFALEEEQLSNSNSASNKSNADDPAF